MKIPTINNDKSSTTFGYNKALNKLVEKTLSKDLSPENKLLLQLNKICNEGEDVLDVQTKFKSQDESGAYDEATEKLIGFVADLKMKFAETINDRFPKLNYARQEIQGYQKEVGDNELHWKTELIDAINDVDTRKTFTIEMK